MSQPERPAAGCAGNGTRQNGPSVLMERPRRHLPAATLLAIVGSLALVVAAVTVMRPAPPARAHQERTTLPHALFVPTRLSQAAESGARVTAPVVLALHGMGGSGTVFSQGLRERAEAEGWVLVAPTLAYGDWRVPETVLQEDLRYTARLAALLDVLADAQASHGIALEPRALVFGYSRGAQLAHRFALFYPQRVAAVAAFSAGTYTLPVRRGAQLPYGAADLRTYLGRDFDLEQVRTIRFLVGVGAQDALPEDVPRAWDAYGGTTRVARAGAFVEALRERGVEAELRLFPLTGHELKLEMFAAALTLFDAVTPEGETPPAEAPDHCHTASP